MYARRRSAGTATDKPKGFLAGLERAGNALPNPFWLFVILAGVVIVSSWLGSKAGMSAKDPASGEVIEVQNLLTSEYLQKMVDAGLKVYYPTEEQAQQFVDATAGVEDLIRAKVGDELVDSYKDAVAAAKAE